MKCFKVYYQDLVGRLDPIHLATMPALKQRNASYPSVKLGELLKVPPQYGSNQVAINGNPLEDVRYIRITDIDEFGNIRNDDWKTAERIEEKYLLRENDILFARSGATAGKAFIYQGQHGKAIFAGYLIRFILDSTRIKPLYLFYYTQSDRYGLWVKAIQRPSGQPNINSMEFKSLEIPLPPLTIQNQVVDIMQSAYQLKKQKEAEAQSLLDSIDEYVLGELGVVTSQGDSRRCFVVWAKELKGKRIDPKAYTAKPKAILESISKSEYPIRTVKELVAEQIAGYWGEAPALTETSENHILCNVIRNTDFDNNLNLNLENVAQRLLPIETYERIKLKAGDLLLEKSGGSPAQPVGRVALITKEQEGYAFSNFVQLLRIHKNECLPEYLFTCLRTIYRLGYMEYIQNQTTGIRNLIIEEFMSIPIPVPSDSSIQDRIASEALKRVQKAKSLQQETIDIIEKAKAEVEHLILGT